MKKGVVLIGILVLLLVVGGSLTSSYNGLVSKQTQVKTAFAEVDNLLQRRSDLVPNLVETVKGIAAQEQAVFGRDRPTRGRAWRVPGRRKNASPLAKPWTVRSVASWS